MKTSKLLFFLIFLTTSTRSQNVENPNFDSIYIGGIDRIHQWITSDSWPTTSGDTIPPLTPFTHYSTSSLQYHEALTTVQIDFSTAFDGPTAVKVVSEEGRVRGDGFPFRGFILNGNDFYTDSTGYIDFRKGGSPFPYRPVYFIGHYKFEDHSPSQNNFPKASVLLKKYNSITQISDPVGYAEFTVQLFPSTTWRFFQIPINYYTSDTPDSVVVVFSTGSLDFNSTFSIDSIGFDFSSPTGLQDQPVNSSEQLFYYNHNEQIIYLSDKARIVSAKIFNVSGQLVIRRENNLPIDISALAEGSYFLKLEIENHVVSSFKIIR